MTGSAEIEVEEARELWSEYRLSDGTVLRIKPVVVEITREQGQFSPDGEPLYHIRFAPIVTVRAPESLKRRPS